MINKLYKEMYKQEEYYWWHLGKRRAIGKLIEKHCNLQPFSKILDVGCGTGKMMEEIRFYYPKSEVWGLDSSKKAVSYCQSRGISNIINSSLSAKLPFNNNEFDLIVALDIIEHLDDDLYSIKELFRLLKTNGTLIVSVPSYNLLWSYWDVMLGHKRRYTKKNLSSVLKNAGFSIININYRNSFLLLPAIFFRLFKGINNKKNNQSSDFIPIPLFANKILLMLFNIETAVANYIHIPFGLSIYCVAKKTG